MSPTLAPILARATARLAATVDFPTPPLPLATGTMFLTRGTSLSFWSDFEARTWEVILMSTCLTPGMAMTARWACSFICSRTGQAGVVSSIVKATRPSQAFTSLTKPRATMSLWRSGSWTTRSAFNTWSCMVWRLAEGESGVNHPTKANAVPSGERPNIFLEDRVGRAPAFGSMGIQFEQQLVAISVDKVEHER